MIFVETQNFASPYIYCLYMFINVTIFRTYSGNIYKPWGR